ncbi:MAG: hypothetical protein KIT45_10565 [Fimbriimonadia bacterium]|nr:hypothetical protein [Fimbriimonadia bacterium]
MKAMMERQRIATGLRWIMGGLVGCLIFGAHAQTYRNVVNRPFATVSNGPQNVIVIDVPTRTRSLDSEAMDRLIRERALAATRAQMEAVRPMIRFWKERGIVPPDFQLPIHQVVVLRHQGRLILPERTRNGLGNGTLTFRFSTVLNEQFPSAYQTLLQRVVTGAMPLIEADYGKPAQTRTITIVNYDETIGDRDAVAGGIYDVSNDRLLFPIYNAAESAAVNLTHLMARAYHGSAQLAYDAWEEGFARAVTTRVARSNAFRAIQGLNADFIEQTLENTYDARSYYDFWNQASLGSPSFIAPSLRQSSIAGGTTGGLWLTRYLMAGSAWLKILTEHPTFLKEFNARYYSQYQTGLEGNVPQLIAIAKSTLSSLAGTNDPKVEGISFETWFKQQYILDTSVTYGRKLHVQLFPYVGQIQQGEEAAFIVFLNYFQTVQSGSNWDESLLSGTCYPVYWDHNFNRLTLSPQYERVDIRVGSGSVVPSFIGDDVKNQRLTIDFSVGTESVRVPYPASKVQGVSFQNDFFGVVYGLENGSVKIDLENGVTTTTPVTKGAFGATLPAPGLNRDQRATLTFQNASGQTVGTARLNTGPSFQGVIVSLNSAQRTFRLNLSAGLHMIGLPLRPFTTDMATLLGIPANSLLLAHWRQEKYQFTTYPATPPPAPGVGYFIQLDSPINVEVVGQGLPTDQSASVGLQVGWNLISNPFNSPVRVVDLLVAHALNEPVSWQTATEAIGGQSALVGSGVFTLGTGGIYVSATQLEPGKAYWVRVLRPEGVTLIFPPPNRSRSVAHERTTTRAAQWEMPLQLGVSRGDQFAELSVRLDPRASAGLDALDIEMPPAFTGAMVAQLEGSSGRGSAIYQSEARPPSAKQEWTLQLIPDQPDEPHTLRWQVPNANRRWRVTLLDPTTGQRIDMRRQREYRFVPGGTRSLKVTVEPLTRAPLQILNLQASPTRGGQVTAQFMLSGSGSVTAEIRSTRGERLRLLQPTRSADTGLHQLTWNGRDQNERSLPPGTYMLHVEAADEEGRVARAARPIVVVR